MLISASACNPYLGSENYFGWAAIKCLSQDHDLYVITAARDRPDIERAGKEGLVPNNVRFAFAGRFKSWHPNGMVARLQSWKEYVSFSKESLKIAERLHREIGFDGAHHVTFASWRVASPLWKLGIPFIFGPVGGFEQFPGRLLSILSPQAMTFELVRMMANRVGRRIPSVRATIRHAVHVFAANPETSLLLTKLNGHSDKVSILSPAFYSKVQVDAFGRHSGARNPAGDLQFFAGGAVEGRKGMALALHALAKARERGVRFRYRIAGTGPEIPKLQSLAAALGIKDELIIGHSLQGEEYRRELGVSHVYLLPSLRESAGLTMMEAMLTGCVPVVADCCSPGYIVTDECGFKVRVSSRARMVDDLVRAILTLNENRSLLAEKGHSAQARIATAFAEANYRTVVNSAYFAAQRRSSAARAKHLVANAS